MNRVIEIGSKVIYRGAWGTEPEKEVTIEGMQLCEEEGDKYGIDTDEIPWEQKNYGVYDLSDGHWCYGYQIVELVDDVNEITLDCSATTDDGVNGEISAASLYFDNGKIVVRWVDANGADSTSDLLEDNPEMIWEILKSIKKT